MEPSGDGEMRPSPPSRSGFLTPVSCLYNLASPAEVEQHQQQVGIIHHAVAVDIFWQA
jgi:hypothetical protein